MAVTSATENVVVRSRVLAFVIRRFRIYCIGVTFEAADKPAGAYVSGLGIIFYGEVFGKMFVEKLRGVFHFFLKKEVLRSAHRSLTADEQKQIPNEDRQIFFM